MLKPLLIVISGLSATSFFSSWGIFKAVNKIQPDGMEWFRQGADLIIKENKKTHGLAIQIPNDDFSLNCDSLNNDSKVTTAKNTCESLQSKWQEIKQKIKGNDDSIDINKDETQWMGDGECGIITWEVDKYDNNTNLANLAKFLLRIYCFEAKTLNKGETFNKEFIKAFYREAGGVPAGDLVGGIFSNYTEGRDIGNKITANNIKENLSRLINTQNNKKLSDWANLLSGLINEKFVLRVDDEFQTNSTKKWLSIQKITD